MAKPQKIYIGVAWPYVNDLFHLGNLAGAYLPPDVFKRYHELKGNEVLMVSGSDFHGTPITLRAEKENLRPEEVARKFHELDKEYLKKFRINYSLYTSTHTKNHQKVVQEMFLQLLKHGFIKIIRTKQLYSEHSGKFLQDRYVEGECPYCHCQEARGDQCEKCGRCLDGQELINPVSKIDKSPLSLKETENYFLDLTLLQKDIKTWLLSRKEWREWVKSEALGWVEEGLKPRAITRDLDYGVPLPIKKIPKDQRIENIESKVFYVWFEAVIGYLSAAVEYSQKVKVPSYWKKFFYNKEAKTYYFVGQDNLVFHTINWPAQLLAYDKKINLPENVFVNKFLLLEGQKMSKSRGWYLNNKDLLDNYSADSIRFYLLMNLPEIKEFSFGWEDFVKTNNNILVATIGNFVNRTLILAKNNFGLEYQNFSVASEIKQELNSAFGEIGKMIEKGEFRSATQRLVDVCDFGNKYLEKEKPWELVKTDRRRAEEVIKNCLVLVFNLQLILSPFLPDSAEFLQKILGRKTAEKKWEFVLPSKIKLPEEILPLFKKIPEERIALELEKLKR